MRHRLLPVSDIPQTGSISADLLGREVLVTLVNGKPRAYINVCQHHGGPLVLEGDRFTCEWHGSQFDARTAHFDARAAQSDARTSRFDVRAAGSDARTRRFDARAVVGLFLLVGATGVVSW